MTRRHSLKSYRIISIMFWAFPYLLWQTFGHWSGFVVGLIIAVVLTAMFNGLINANVQGATSTAKSHASQAAEPQSQEQEEGAYQRGYRAKVEPYRAESASYSMGELQPQYEEMQLSYPQETMPPMEQK
jgi:hypothetical protein